MAALGDKIAANILAQTAGVPSIPWSGQGLVAELNAEGKIPQDIFDSAMVRTADEACAAAAKIGYPVMLKASEGGGGKGIRMSKNEQELRTNFVQVSNEVPGSPMFMMQLCTNARHLEVQIIGDDHGVSFRARAQKLFVSGAGGSR
jgi:acetyl-CoA carboxylase/biotin carboxylase 1